jgi:hypothetical protein
VFAVIVGHFAPRATAALPLGELGVRVLFEQLYELIDRFHFDFMHTGYQVPHMLEREPTLRLINHFN